jgi:hypothetical protein
LVHTVCVCVFVPIVIDFKHVENYVDKSFGQIVVLIWICKSDYKYCFRSQKGKARLGYIGLS